MKNTLRETEVLSRTCVLVMTIVLACPFVKGQTTDDFDIAQPGYKPSIAVSQSGGIGIAWTNEHVYFRLLNPSGSKLEDSLLVSQTAMAEGARIEFGKSNGVIVWRIVTYFLNSYIEGRLITALGDTTGPEALINDEYYDAQRAAARICLLTDSTFLVAWIGNGPQTPSGTLGIYFQPVTDSLRSKGMNTFVVGESDSVSLSGPVIASSEFQPTFAIAWVSSTSSNSTLSCQVFDKELFVPISPVISFSDTTHFGFFSNPSIAMDTTGSFTIVWSAGRKDGSWGIYMWRLSADWTPIDVPQLINEGDIAPFSVVSLSCDNQGNAFAAWEITRSGEFYVKGQRLENWSASGPAFFVSSTADGTQQLNPDVVVRNGNIYLVWERYLQSGSSIVGRTIDFHDPSVGIQQVGNDLPARFELFQNYPNPFNPSTSVRFSLVRSSHVEVLIFDVVGRVVKKLFSGELQAGIHTFRWDGDSPQKVLPSGVYFCQIETDAAVKTIKMLLLR